MRTTALLVALTLAAGQPGGAAPADAEDLDLLLARASAYVAQFEQSFAQVIGTEDYQQQVLSWPRRQSRSIRSEVFLVRLPEAHAWLTIRNVLKVDNRAVRGSHDRIMDALSGAPARRLSRLRALADEGARYNIGSLRRNFADPTLALTFLDPANRPRFAFEPAGAETIDGVLLHRIRFDETGRPTLVRNGRTGADVPARGRLFLAEDGRVMRTELELEVQSDITASVRVQYRHDAKLEMLVPATMQETYTQSGDGAFGAITCSAVYSDFRRFETAGHVLP